MAYTDGSVITKPTVGGGTATFVGAGVYHPATAAQITIDPNGQGPTNTINRAELAGIWGALKQGFTKIATDSASSIAQIRKMILNPMQLNLHKHKCMVQAVVELILASDQHVTLMKIKAHNQHPGNEGADATAKKATNPHTTHDLTVQIDQRAGYEEGYWLYHTTGQDTNTSHTPSPDQTAPTQAVEPQGRPVENLQGNLHRIMHKKHKCGISNTD
jgi:ribonuclease HI